jgi:tetratricopeptide (TPR) repeat protein
LAKAPNTARSYMNLAYDYLYRKHDYQKAFELYFLSLDKYSPTPWKNKLRAYNNLGYIMSKVGNHDKAVMFYDKAINEAESAGSPDLTPWTVIRKSETVWAVGREEEAIKMMQKLTEQFPQNVEALLLLGRMLAERNKHHEALESYRNCLVYSAVNIHSPDYQKALLNISLLYIKLDMMEKAGFYLKFSQYLGTPDIPLNLCRMELHIRKNNHKMAEKSMVNILDDLSWLQFATLIDKETDNGYSLCVDYNLLRSYVKRWIATKKNDI